MAESLAALIADGLAGVRLVFGADGRPMPAAEVAETGTGFFSPRADVASIGVVMTNDRPSVEVLLGAIASGVRLVSLPLPSRGVNLLEYAAFLQRACAVLDVAEIVVADAFAGLLEQAGLRVRRHSERDRRLLAAPAPQGFQLLQFTSGSTGEPRPVRLGDHELGANLAAILGVVQPRPGDNVVSWLPLAHDMGLIGMLLTGMAAGSPGWAGRGTIVLLDPRDFMRRPGDWLATLAHWRGSFSAAPDFAFRMATRWEARLPSTVDLSRLRCVIVGGEIVRSETLTEFAAAFGDRGFDSLAFCPAYGMAELGVATTLTAPEAHWHSTATAVPGVTTRSLDVVACGPPLPGYEVRVETEEGDGNDGTVLVRGPSVGTDAMTGQPLADPDGWHRTGDIGFVADGEVHVLGRHDDYMVVHGQNLYAPSIEDGVGRLAGVRDGRVGAVGLMSGSWVVVVEPAEREALSDRAVELLRREVRRAVVEVAGARPDDVIIAERGSMPLTSSGKLQRVRLRALVMQEDRA